MDKYQLNEILEESFKDTEMVFSGHVTDRDEYIKNAIKSIRESKCDPYLLKAVVKKPGFEGKNIGDTIQGYCVAKSEGYWLVYQTEDKVFYCFWGTSEENLGAHGVVGSALECWLA
jgi:hypothetical protein